MARPQRRNGSYVPLSATYASDDDILAAGEKAELLYVRALAFCAGKPEAEGFVSRNQLAVVGLGLAGINGRVSSLVSHGLWVVVDGGWQIRAWLKWNRSAAEIEREKRTDRERKVPESGNYSERNPNGIQTESERTPGALSADSLSDTEQDNNKTSHGSVPDGTQSASPPPKSRRKTQTAIPDGWLPDQKRIDWARAEGVSDDQQRVQTELFRSHALAGDVRYADWQMAWKTWIGKAKGWGQVGPGVLRSVPSAAKQRCTECNLELVDYHGRLIAGGAESCQFAADNIHHRPAA